MNFIRKIVEGKNDSFVKRQFTRYGKGNYEHKALIQITQGKHALSISTSFEFASDLAYALAETITGKVRVTGGIITTQKLTEADTGIPFTGDKQFAGIHTFLLDTELTKTQVQNILQKYSSTLVLLSFKTEKGELKTKVKNPKSAKAGNEEEPENLPKANFCHLKTKDKRFLEDYVFDISPDFTKVFISHTFSITDLEIPQGYENDFATARLHAVRKGTLIREIHLNEKTLVKQYKLEV